MQWLMLGAAQVGAQRDAQRPRGLCWGTASNGLRWALGGEGQLMSAEASGLSLVPHNLHILRCVNASCQSILTAV